MQTFGLPRHLTRGAALASRLCATERSDEAHRRDDILKRWHRARDNGLSAAAAADAVGVSRATLYRWRSLRRRGRLTARGKRAMRAAFGKTVLVVIDADPDLIDSLLALEEGAMEVVNLRASGGGT